MQVPKKILLASRNKNKLEEMRAIFKLLSGENIDLFLLNDLNIEGDVIEDGHTFEENANKKALFFYKKAVMPTLADDSGLEVEYLNGEPGIYSKRFGKDDSERITKLLTLLEDVPENKRKARFVCSMVLYFDNDKYIKAVGYCEGYISNKPAGNNGFGYDPVFFIPDKNKTMAELSFEEKNRISHRAESLRNLFEKLGKY